MLSSGRIKGINNDDNLVVNVKRQDALSPAKK
jgi:hypothetical protein